MSVEPTRAQMQGRAATEAIKHTDRARRALEDLAGNMQRVVHALAHAHAQKAHLALGYETWEEYCREEFASVRRTRVEIPQRVEIVAALTAVGMLPADVGSALGISKGTVDRDIARGQDDGGRALPPSGRGETMRAVATAGHDAGAVVRAERAGRTVVGEVLAETPRRRPTMPWPGQHFAQHHDLHAAASERCKGRGHQNTSAYGACGPCWEAVIRADERSKR